jgi:tetratricopeptide (TPR) repeat protein
MDYNFRFMRSILLLFVVLGMQTGCGPLPPTGQQITSLQAGSPYTIDFGPQTVLPVSRGNAAMAQDFLDLSFALENGVTLDRLSRFETPITIRLLDGAPGSMQQDLSALLQRLQAEARIPITQVASSSDANITVETLSRFQIQRVIPDAACFVVPRVSSWDEFQRASGGLARRLDWRTLEERQNLAIFIPNDVSAQEMRDCLHEEIAQALGPLNDLYRLPDSVFNDDNMHAVLTGFDMLMLRAYYSPSLRSGMTRGQVAAALPGILAQLNPRGGRIASQPRRSTPPDWTRAIETALGPGQNSQTRIAAARNAVQIATQNQLAPNQQAFSYFVLGQVLGDNSPQSAYRALVQAQNLYRQAGNSDIQNAHVALDLAVFEVNRGNYDAALDLTQEAITQARAAQHASLLATLLVVQSSALDQLARQDEAREARRQSLLYAQYGFGLGSPDFARILDLSARDVRQQQQ